MLNDAEDKKGRSPASKARSSGVLVDGRRIAESRKKAGHNQTDFAQKCGISLTTLKKLELRPDQRVHPQTLQDIAKTLGVETRTLVVECPPPRIISSTEEIVAINMEIAGEAQKFLYATGCRSKDKAYLSKIEEIITARPELSHIRIVFGTPITKQILEHIERLVALKSGGEDRFGKLMLARYENPNLYPAEAAVCMNEKKALYVLPSITGAWRYDTAIVFEDPKVIEGWQRWIEEMYRSGFPVETSEAFSELKRSRNLPE